MCDEASESRDDEQGHDEHQKLEAQRIATEEVPSQRNDRQGYERNRDHLYGLLKMTEQNQFDHRTGETQQKDSQDPAAQHFEVSAVGTILRIHTHLPQIAALIGARIRIVARMERQIALCDLA